MKIWETLGALLPLCLKFIEMYLEKNNADVETKRAFLEFVGKASKNFTNSSALKNSWNRQKERMDEMEKPK